MAKAKKTWREKLADDKDLPKVGKIEGKTGGRLVEAGGHKVVPKGRSKARWVVEDCANALA